MVNLRIKEGNSGKKYYYLEHTTRVGHTFLNKRKYLGTQLPKDLGKIKEQFIVALLVERYGKALETIKEQFDREFAKYPDSAKAQELERFMIKFTYNTNRIEGSTLTLKETADLLQQHITPSNKPLEEVKETEAHKKVFYTMLEHVGGLNLAGVLHWHNMLLGESKPDIAGKIRKHPVAIARSKVELPLPAELDTLLYEFFKWYKYSTVHPVIRAALVHLKFVTIHPFADGNGRVSRLLMNFVLQKHGYPMLSIEYTNRNTYYHALERSQLSKNDYHFAHYLVKRYLGAYERYLGAVRRTGH